MLMRVIRPLLALVGVFLERYFWGKVEPGGRRKSKLMQWNNPPA